MTPTLLFVLFTALAFVLFTAEVFVPGGILGTLGGICLLIASGFSIQAFGWGMGLLTSLLLIFTTLIGFIIWLSIMPNTRVGKRFALSHSLEEPEAEPSPLLEQTGVAETDLRPGGFARIDGKKLDVVARRGYVEKGTSVEVVEVHGSRIVVRPVENA